MQASRASQPEHCWQPCDRSAQNMAWQARRRSALCRLRVLAEQTRLVVFVDFLRLCTLRCRFGHVRPCTEILGRQHQADAREPIRPRLSMRSSGEVHAPRFESCRRRAYSSLLRNASAGVLFTRATPIRQVISPHVRHEYRAFRSTNPRLSGCATYRANHAVRTIGTWFKSQHCVHGHERRDIRRLCSRSDQLPLCPRNRPDGNGDLLYR
jgi:hypothetical protein